MKKYGKKLSNPVTLVLPNGDKWEVNWIKRDHDVWFQKGWENFAQHYSMSYGHFLVFRFETSSQFQVTIFDKSALELDYWSIPSPRDEVERNIHHHEDAEKSGDKDDYIEISDESERLRSLSPQPLKRMKTSDGPSQRKKLKKEKIIVDQKIKGKL